MTRACTRIHHVSLICFVLTFMFSCHVLQGQTVKPRIIIIEDVEPARTFSGVNQNTDQAAALTSTPVIGDQQTWEEVWDNVVGTTAPEVDFANRLIVAVKGNGPNVPRLHSAKINPQGDLSVETVQTRKGGPGFGYAFFVFKRDRIKSFHGHAVPAITAGEPTADGIYVTFVGSVQTGVMAIGGETTGTTISAKGITWELECNAQIQEVFQAHADKRFRVKGELQSVAGVERGQRWIISVTEATPLDHP